jgi:hypothetical protein
MENLCDLIGRDFWDFLASNCVDCLQILRTVLDASFEIDATADRTARIRLQNFLVQAGRVCGIEKEQGTKRILMVSLRVDC